MLVLARKADQTIQIGHGVTIRVLEISGSTVRIGVKAPRQIPVMRGELLPSDEEVTRSLVKAFDEIDERMAANEIDQRRQIAAEAAMAEAV